VCPHFQLHGNLLTRFPSQCLLTATLMSSLVGKLSHPRMPVLPYTAGELEGRVGSDLFKPFTGCTMY